MKQRLVSGDLEVGRSSRVCFVYLMGLERDVVSWFLFCLLRIT
jgi:hypothetical protein